MYLKAGELLRAPTDFDSVPGSGNEVDNASNGLTEGAYIRVGRKEIDVLACTDKYIALPNCTDARKS